MYDDKKTHISSDSLPTDFSLDDILAEYKSEVPEVPPENEDLAQRSKRIVMEAIGQTISEASFSSIDDIIGDAVSEQENAAPARNVQGAQLHALRDAPRARTPARDAEPELYTGESEPEPPRSAARGKSKKRAGANTKKPQPAAPVKAPGAEYTAPVPLRREESDEDELTERENEIISQLERESAGHTAAGARPDGQLDEFGVSDADDAGYARPDIPEPEDEGSVRASEKHRENAKERFLSPIVALLALIALRQGQKRKADARPEPVDEAEEELPEPDPEKAARLYSAQTRSLKLRGRLAAFMSLIMVYLSFAFYTSLPLTGAMHGNARVVSLVLLVFELTVMVIGLDVLTSGIMSLVRRRPGLDSLTAVSCVLTLIDAAVLAGMDAPELGLPFSAVSALSLTFGIWGSYYNCRGFRAGFKLLAMSKNIYSVSAESGVAGSGTALLKSRRGTKGFIRRSEEADISEYAYSAAAPLVLVIGLILGLLASVCHHQSKAAVHCISMIIAVSSSFSAAICFALPFSITARRLFQSGAAVAGWSGVRDIGNSQHVIITDGDVFPSGTVEIAGIRILEGSFTDKVISYTGSVIAASGSGLAPVFSDLIRRNGYSISRIENFAPHDGGGMTAMVNGESVYVGSAGFMNLMGIRVPQKLASKSAVFSAINGSLVGIFNINYKPVASVQDALALLLRSRREPIFAIRDFNITPLMIKKKFRMPTDVFEFPTYTERYRISGAEPGETSRIAAVVTREGMGPLVDAAERGRRLYSAARAGTAISVAGTVIGGIMMFLLCWLGAFDSATAANALIFMLLWLLPTAVISWGLQR